MSVYVDNLLLCPKNKNWRYNKACHLVADTVCELHAFAKKIGLKRIWFRSHPRLPHYDLTASKRQQAVRRGATEITAEQLVRRMKGSLSNEP